VLGSDFGHVFVDPRMSQRFDKVLANGIHMLVRKPILQKPVVVKPHPVPSLLLFPTRFKLSQGPFKCLSLKHQETTNVKVTVKLSQIFVLAKTVAEFENRHFIVSHATHAMDNVILVRK